MPLVENAAKIKSEFGQPTSTALGSSFHVRWYVTKKNSDGDYEKIPNSEYYLEPITDFGHQTEPDQGLYWNSVTSGKTIADGYKDPDLTKVLNVKLNREPLGHPALTGSWEDYKVYVVLTRDLTGQTDDSGTPAHLTKEPTNLTMIYTYGFFVESTFRFVHDKGASERNYITPSSNAELQATVQQYSWDNSVSNVEPVTGDIRQGVHTVEYDVYVDPTSSMPVELHLPFQKYNDDGNDLEPTAYIRWYDWNTDVNNNRLAIVGTALSDKTEINQGATISRGFFMLNNDESGVKPTHSLVGVTFKPLGLDGQVSIACDVSKFYDGIYTGSAGEYLMHEPTLSTRYIFRVRPSSVIATDIHIGKTKFEAAGSDMFQLAEDNGRVSVAFMDENSKFSVRAALPMLNYYFIPSGSTQIECSRLSWYAYYEDETGVYQKNDILVDKSENRITEITISSLNGGYTAISGGGTKTITAGKGQRFHIVGFVGNGTVMEPAVHYEMILVDAPAYKIEDLPLERTEAYLTEHMTLQATVDFDNLGGLTLSDDLTSQLQNHSTEPLPWDEAQYGFCYPDVRRVYDYPGISPLHGDYMLLKSIAKEGISKSETLSYYYKYLWWNGGNEMLDYTYYNGLINKGKYGSFLYVDASDESRTIAQMKFNANLCVGSELCFTGFIADLTGKEEKPQVMATVYGVKANGDRVRVVSFHSSNLKNSAYGGLSSSTWYQIYGRVAIPNTVDLTGVESYVVDIDNYATTTDGADYAVDQLQFYTSNAKLKVKQSGINCGAVKVPLNLYVEAEQIESMGGKTIFWRICDKDGNALTDASLYNNSGKLYGQTSVPATVVPVAEASLPYPGSGYFTASDGKVYFSLANQGFALKEGEDYYISVYNMSETSVSHESFWGNPADECSVFSPVFIPKVMYLTMEDDAHNIVTSLPYGCSDKKANVNLNVILNMPDDNEVSGFKKYDNVHYDYFLGTLAEAKAYKITVGSNDYYLVDALADYRNRDGLGSDFYKTATTLESGYASVNQNYYDVIKKAIDEGKLFLSYSSKCNVTVTGDADNKAYISAFPAEEKVNNGISDFLICSPLEYVFDIDVSGNAPSLTLGFENVTYPSGIRVVRVGLEQLTNMQKVDGFILHIPVNTFKKNDIATAKDGTLEILGDLDLLAYSAAANQTSDDQIITNINKVATFEVNDISSSHMYVSVNFHGAGVTKPTFHEGFTYRMFFQFKDKDGGAGACEGNAEFLLKVVPKYVTWNGGSDEWNNDANWQRSTRTELNKGDKSSATNTDDYENNSEGSLTTIVTTPKTFVPMKFTYVTILMT